MLDSDLLSLRDRAIGSLLSDGRICIIKDQLVVTTLSYLSTELQKRPWLIKGNRLRTQTGLPWLVVHHYPPALYQSAGPEELSAGKLAREFEPTFWLSGRFYEEPYQKEFVWFQRINRTIVLNAAQYPTTDRMAESPLPSYIILDLTKGSATRYSPSLNRIEEATLMSVGGVGVPITARRVLGSAPESTHQQWGESPHRTEALVCP